jgi:hypothetical protein
VSPSVDPSLASSRCPDDRPTPISRAVLALYLLTVALLPWSWFPPFPWLHEHAQWSDATFAVTTALWLVECWNLRRWPRLRAVHGALALYAGSAALSLLFAAPDRHAGAMKLLGMIELCVLFLITADLVARPGCPRSGRMLHAFTLVVAASSLLTAAAAVVGLLLFYLGFSTRLIGIYGDLTPSPFYARVEGGLYHPHLLANFCIFASAVVTRADAELPPWLRRLTQSALWVTVALTFSRAILGFLFAAALRSAPSHRRCTAITACAILCAGLLSTMSIWKLSFDPGHPLRTHFDPGVHARHWYTVTSSFHTLLAHPLLGSGVGTSPGWYHGAPFDAHLTLLNIAATMGLPALAAFVCLHVLLWRSRRHPIDLATWSGIAGMALDGLASDIEDFRHLWVLLGLADAAGRLPASVAPAPVASDSSANV